MVSNDHTRLAVLFSALHTSEASDRSAPVAAVREIAALLLFHLRNSERGLDNLKKTRAGDVVKALPPFVLNLRRVRRGSLYFWKLSGVFSTAVIRNAPGADIQLVASTLQSVNPNKFWVSHLRYPFMPVWKSLEVRCLRYIHMRVCMVTGLTTGVQ